jgi:hypothetical protein
MYNKLRYTLLHQRARSTTCETLSGQTIIYQLEGIGVVDDIAEQWRMKRDDYLLAPTSLPYLLLDYMYRQARMLNGNVKIPIADLNPRAQCLAMEFQRHWVVVAINVKNALLHEQPDAMAAALLAALNAGAWLDSFLWRDANREAPINLF